MFNGFAWKLSNNILNKITGNFPTPAIINIKNRNRIKNV